MSVTKPTSNIGSVELKRPETECVNTRPGLTLNRIGVDWRAAMQSTEPTICAFCSGPFTAEQLRRKRTYCSKSCRAKASSAAFRGIVCTVDKCDRIVASRGYCTLHYNRLRNGRDLTAPVPAWREMTESERFWSKVRVGGPDECWEWQGPKNNHGYGRFSTYTPDRKRHLAHRYALRDAGVLDESLVILHACDNPPCCNPAHLRQGTQGANMRDAREKGRLNTSGLALAPNHATHRGRSFHKTRAGAS